MSWHRQIETLFTLSFLIFTYIIWITLSTLIINNNVNYTVYIISLCSVFLMQYLSAKQKKPVFQVLIPFISVVAVNLLIFNINSAQYNSFYIFLTLIYFKRLENEEIDYEIYKSRVKKFIYILIALGVTLPLIDKELAQNVFRLYLVYLISAVIVLRETRKFSSRISDKKSLFVNLSIIFAVMLLSMDKIYNFTTMVFSYVWFGINFILIKILTGVAYIVVFIIYKPLYFILQLLFSHLAKRGPVDNKPIDIGVNLNKLSQDLKVKDSSVFVFVVILKIIVVIFMAYLMIKAFDICKKKNSYDDEGEVQKEKILREDKKNKEGNLSRFIKLFKRKMDVRTQILNVYLKFEHKMSDKEIYKPHMTAGQLSSAAKTQIDDIEAINSITSIYNEAKFSNHEIPEKNAETAKLNYESIRKKV